MSDALRTLRSAIDGATTYFALSLGANLLTLGLSLPFAIAIAAICIAVHASGVLPLALPMALIILPNPFAAGLHAIADQLAIGDSFVDLRDIWRRVGPNWWKVARAWLIGVAGLLLAVGGIILSTRLRGPVGGLLALVWLYATLAWIVLQLYVYPVLVHEVGTLRQTYRRSLTLLITHPTFSISATAGWLVIVVLACGTGIVFLLGLSLAAAVQHAAYRTATQRSQTTSTV